MTRATDRAERAAPVLFVALMLDPELASQAAAEAWDALGGAEAPRRFRLPRADGLHVTLVYLGAVETDRIEPLERALEAGLAGARAPQLALAAADAFPRRGRERVLWIGVEDHGGELGALHGRVLDAVDSVGFDVIADRNRPYVPHVTVARPKSGGGVPDAFYEVATARPWHPTEACLVESVRGQGPARYVPRARFPLVR